VVATARITVSPTPGAQLTITPQVSSVRVGRTVQLTATLRDAQGQVITGRPVTWSTSDGGVATVGPAGLVTGVAPGAAVITARSDGLSATAGVTVTAVPVASVTVSPSDVTLAQGATRQLTATVRDSTGATVSDRLVTWNTSSAAIATVSSTGEVRANGPGTATITATAEGVSGTARVTVTAAAPIVPVPARVEIVSGNGQSAKKGRALDDPIVVRVLSAAGQPLEGISVAWSAAQGGGVDPVLSRTDSRGQAAARWTLGPSTGTQQAQATVVGLPSATFTATSRP
jgi:uncharacterized protein YjdB